MYAGEVTLTVCKDSFFRLVCTTVQKYIQGIEC